MAIVRQLGQQQISSRFLQVDDTKNTENSLTNPEEAEEIAKEIRRIIHEQLNRLQEGRDPQEPVPSTSSRIARYSPRRSYDPQLDKSELNITDEMKKILQLKIKQKLEDVKMSRSTVKSERKTGGKRNTKKSNLKNASVQLEKIKQKSVHVRVKDPDDTRDNSTNTPHTDDIDKETQTNKEKEKQD